MSKHLITARGEGFIELKFKNLVSFFFISYVNLFLFIEYTLLFVNILRFEKMHLGVTDFLYRYLFDFKTHIIQLLIFTEK